AVALRKESGPAARRGLTERLLARDPGNPRGLNARALDAYQAALAAWTAPPPTPDTRRATAAALLADARRDLRAALAGAPTNPFLHSSLAWVEATDAVVHDRHDAAALAPALTHGLRAVALATDNPGMYESLARLAYTVPRVGLAAAREAARRDPTLVPALVDLYRPLGLTDAEWLALAPARGSDRLELAATLEARGLVRDALAVYRAARDTAPPVERTIYQWALGVALARAGQTQAAAAERDQAAAAWEGLAADAPGDADARYGLGVALEGLGAFDRALEALRAAVAQAPGVVRYRERLAERLWASEQYHQAINEWRTVRDQAPRNVTARLSLARAYEKIGEPADAYREYRAVLEIDPGNADAARALSKFK